MGLIIFICLVAYLAGSVNFAVIIFKLTGKADPRLSFSGNAGTTNIYRQEGIVWAAIILLLDIGRAVAVAFLAVQMLHSSYIPWVGFFLVLGNSYPCFHGFRGGKGVASYLGFSAFISPLSALLAVIIWVAAYGLYRIPFVASFFMVFTLTIGYDFSFNWTISAVSGAAATFLLIIFNHRTNIREYRKNNKPITPVE
jgi:acyl phosphate:glycerol-3-phosphate acyltransferase